MKNKLSSAKQNIDIEQLLIWVYRDQAAEAVTSRAAGFGPALLPGYAYGSGDSTGPVERYGRLGCSVDCAGAAASGNNELHPDAETIYEAVGFNPLIVQHARTGTRPDWMEGEVTHYEPVDGWKDDKEGARVPKRYDYDITVGIGHRPWLCRVRIVNQPSMIIFARAQYGEWWQAMADLSVRLELLEYIASPPSAPACPWSV